MCSDYVSYAMLDVRESAYPYGYVTVQRAGALMENNDSYFIYVLSVFL